MNRYTIELCNIEEDLGYNLFDENFPFYEPSLREHFVKKFYDRYRFREIGAETIYRFKLMLNGRLNLIMPYYTQLYQTELESKKCNFMLNKDLKETFVREITGQNNVESTSSTNTTGESNSTSEGRFLDTPSSKVTDEELEGYLTNAQKDKVNGRTTANGTSTNTSLGNNNQRETTDLVSQGNIGITSSGQLLEDWRKILINIDMMILDELKDLFFGLY